MLPDTDTPEIRLDDDTLKSLLMRLCNLLSASFGAPICAVSLLEKEGVRHLVIKGMDMETAPLEDSFAVEVVKHDGVLCIPNAPLHNDFAAHRFVNDAPYIRAYAGAPLRAANGRPIGAIEIIDLAPYYKITDEMRSALEDSAELASALLQLSHRGSSGSL